VSAPCFRNVGGSGDSPRPRPLFRRSSSKSARRSVLLDHPQSARELLEEDRLGLDTVDLLEPLVANRDRDDAVRQVQLSDSSQANEPTLDSLPVGGPTIGTPDVQDGFDDLFR
jgi:hypothetical protein